jgi:hypothetical protein
MATAATIRRQIESALADRIPSALTPQPRTVRPVWPTGVAAVERFQPAAKVVPLRKPPARETGAGWQARSAWAGGR